MQNNFFCDIIRGYRESEIIIVGREYELWGSSGGPRRPSKGAGEWQ
jgi:hypothetical protein